MELPSTEEQVRIISARLAATISVVMALLKAMPNKDVIETTLIDMTRESPGAKAALHHYDPRYAQLFEDAQRDTVEAFLQALRGQM